MPLLRVLARIWFGLLGITTLTLLLGLAVRSLLPVAPWNELPNVQMITPADGSSAVLPRSEITLNFTMPMNRQTTLAALRIEPPTEGSFRWSDDGLQLSFVPRSTLAADSTYTVSLERSALSRWWQPLATAAQARFRTAPSPAVLSALPNSVATPTDSAVAVIFSQAMVAPQAVGQPALLPQVQISPSIELNFEWIDQRTLLARPTRPFQAATAYTLTIDSGLSDLRGVDLGRPFSWQFATDWPGISERTPLPGERWAGPRQPLRFQLSTPLERDFLEEALAISPPVEGSISVEPAAAGQVVTFTPRDGWEPGRSYTIALQAPPDRQIGPAPDLRWRFTVEPLPALVAFFPGQSQAILPDQPVRLVFSTPMEEEALRAGLRIEPPVGEPEISVSGTEVRLRPALAPSTTYTITIAAGTLDRSGEPLAAPGVVRLRTAAADPLLAAPAAFNRLITSPISSEVALDLEHRNLSRVDLELYQLDTPTLLRTFGFAGDDWRDFDPQRYGQALVRRWQVDLNNPSDTRTQSQVPIELNDGTPPAGGSYYLRVSSREGLRLDLLLLVSQLRLSLRSSDNQVVVWATDAQSGLPQADVPLALYAGDALITRSRSGPDGVWEQPLQRTALDPPYLVVAEGDQPAVVSAAWARSQAAALPRHRALILSDRQTYAPGDTVELSGEVRRIAANGGLILPLAGTTCRIQISADRSPQPPAPPEIGCSIAPNGDLRAQVRLSAELVPGHYTLRIQIADTVSTLPLRVVNRTNDATLSVARSNSDFIIRAQADGFPLAQAIIRWTLRMEPIMPPAELRTMNFGPLPDPQVLSGEARTDAEGRLLIALPDAPAPGLRYRLTAEVATNDGRRAHTNAVGAITNADVRVGLALPQQVVFTDERAAIEVATLADSGRFSRGQAITIEVFRGDDTSGAPLLLRRTVSDSRGRAAVQLVPLRPGVYTVRAAAGNDSISSMLYVVGNGYNAWENPPGQVAIIADRAAYQPGDVARLLVTSPYPTATLLLTQERDDLQAYRVAPLQAGRLITLTISADMAPGIALGALLSAEQVLVGSTYIPVNADTPTLNLSLGTDQTTYLPGATAALSVTLRDAQGPTSADLWLALSPDDGTASAVDPVPSVFTTPPPAGLNPAVFGQSTAPPPPSERSPMAFPGVLVPLQAGAGGLGTVNAGVTLPEQPGRWRISSYAFDESGVRALASTVITTAVPLEVTLEAPAVLRPGDQAIARIIVRNSSTTTASVQLDLSSTGMQIDGQTNLQRSIVIAPEATQSQDVRLSNVGPEDTVVLEIDAGLGDYQVELRESIPVIGMADPLPFAENTYIADEMLTLDNELAAVGLLDVRVAPGLRAALAAELAQPIDPSSIEDNAARLIIAAALAERGDPVEREAYRALAAAAWDQLATAQNSDGGWGWWVRSPSTPFISAFAVEAQAAAAPVLGSAYAPSLRAIAYLERVGSTLPPDLRAYIAYVLQQTNRPVADLLSDLPENDLDPTGLAFLVLIQPNDARLDRLSSLAANSEVANAASGLPADRLIRSAVRLQALQAQRPEPALLAELRRTIGRAWGFGGWPSPFAAARIARSIRTAETAAVPIERIALGDDLLVSEPISSTQELRIPAAAVGESLSIRAAPGGEILLVTRSPGIASDNPTPLLVRLSDDSGATLDPDQLRFGQVLTLEVTMIITQPLLRADLEIALPSAFELRSTSAVPPFSRIAYQRDERLLQLGAVDLQPGIYRLQLAVQTVALGTFGAPAPRLLAPYNPNATLYARNPLSLRVQPNP